MSSDIGRLLRHQRTNAVLSWLLIGLLVIAIATSVWRDRLWWAAFALAVVALAVLPPVRFQSWQTTLPWEVTGLAALPVLGRAYATVPVTGQVATYLSVAAISLVVVVELHLFTPVRMTDGFAVAFVVVTTLAMAGVWAVFRWSADILLGTTLLLKRGVPEAEIEHALMIEFVASTVAGVAAGLIFAFYVRRQVEATEHLPPEVTR
ncbi:hypothetical protein [Halomicrobium sp. LC1Hm]|uniref:hypothetical protein n=1 Tax=Halomicrobium sp. LC1Hm TaxID=2610902 RepID=UPI0012984408|nr:hypothetical protein [Halomicrobium sp. LC1Hm]QGA82932.1 putative membrane protein [Halomicrobium sp. LC1Hm]